MPLPKFIRYNAVICIDGTDHSVSSAGEIMKKVAVNESSNGLEVLSRRPFFVWLESHTFLGPQAWGVVWVTSGGVQDVTGGSSGEVKPNTDQKLSNRVERERSVQMLGKA